MKSLIITIALCSGLAAFANDGPSSINESKVGAQFEFDRILREEIKNDSRFEGANVSASFLDGYVTLNGYVDNIWQKERLIKIGQSVNGSRGVIDKLEVGVTSVDSESLAKQVALALYRDESADVFQLQVVTDDYGRVALSGSADSAEEAQAAKQAAQRVKGVTFVADKIFIGKKAKRTDEEIKADVRFALQNDVLIDSDLLSPKVSKQNVKYEGKVGSAQEAMEVSKLTKKVSGVGGVNITSIRVVPKLDRSAIFKVESLSEGYTDKELAKNVEEANYYDTRVFSYNIDVKAKNGVVLLSGVAKDSDAKDAALENAQNTVGVKRVIDRIEIDPYSVEQELAE